MMRSARLRISKPVIFLLAVGLLLAGTTGLLFTSTASALTPQLVARADCSAHVTFTATAGDTAGITDDQRSSTAVDVQYSTDGTQFTSVRGADANKPDGSLYTFTTANNFTFGDSFVVPANVQRPGIIQLRVIANGTATAVIPVALPGACGVPSASITQPSCSLAAASVSLTNSGTDPIEFGLYQDASMTPFKTVNVANGTQTILVPVTQAYLLSVHGGNMAEVQANVAPAVNCDPNAPAATVTNGNDPADTTTTTSTSTTTSSTTTTSTTLDPNASLEAGCSADAMGWTVTYDNSKGSTPVDYVVTDDLGVNLDSTIVPAGAAVNKVYPFTVTTGTDVSISGNGVFIAKGPSKVACVNPGASIDTACNTPAGNGVVLGFTNTGEVPETFSVARDGKEVQGSPFTITPSQDVTQKLLPLGIGQTTDVKVMGNNGFTLDKSVTLTCTPAAQVLGKQISKGNLAFTGIDVTAQMTLATVLVAIGATLLYASVDFGFAGRYEGVKSVASQLRVPFVFLASPLGVRDWFGELVAPKGKHYRRR